jgi:hypothetical protein
MGFPDDWCREARIYDQYALFGNAIVPVCVEWVCKRIGLKKCRNASQNFYILDCELLRYIYTKNKKLCYYRCRVWQGIPNCTGRYGTVEIPCACHVYKVSRTAREGMVRLKYRAPVEYINKEKEKLRSLLVQKLT